MTNKLFKVIGKSNLNGKVKVRFANDMTRVKALIKSGHTDVELFTLPNAMTKQDVIAYAKDKQLFDFPA